MAQGWHSTALTCFFILTTSLSPRFAYRFLFLAELIVIRVWAPISYTPRVWRANGTVRTRGAGWREDRQQFMLTGTWFSICFAAKRISKTWSAHIEVRV